MRRLAATLALVALLAASGCAGSGDSGPGVSTGLPPAGGGGTLSYALPALPSTLDPLAAQTRADQTVTRKLSEPLIEHLAAPYAAALAPHAGLALGARPSPDGPPWTVALRSGIRFQD